MHFKLLGPLEVQSSSGQLAIGPPQRRAVMAMLLMSANKPVRADFMIDALWEGQSRPTSTGALQAHLSRLRQIVGPDRLTREPSGYKVVVDPGSLDVHEFERLTACARRQVAHGDVVGGLASLHDALAQWRGDAYQDFAVSDWAQTERTRLEEMRLCVVEERIDAELQLGEHGTVIPELEVLTHQHPTRERFCSQHMVALYRCGRQLDALRAFRSLRESLRDHYGLDPSPELRELERLILRHDAALDVARDLHCEDRLSELHVPDGTTDCGVAPKLRAEHSSQLNAQRVPAVRRISRHAQSNLPAPITQFIGRRREVSELGELIAANRLTTITGPGGAGKTRLAIEVGRTDTRIDEAAWIDLSEAETTGDILHTTFRSMRLSPQGQAISVETLLQAFHGRVMTLFFDCCERVVESVGEIVLRVLEHCPGVRVVCTSRERLNVRGETSWTTPTLTAPLSPITEGKDALRQFDAINLFVERACNAQPAFKLTADNAQAVIDLCRQVDCLPLGIELVCAQLVDRSLDELPALVGAATDGSDRPQRGRPARHSTLTATIRWSYDTLSANSRALFERLSVFESAASASEVIGIGFVDEVTGRSALASLADKSLLQRVTSDGGPRYRMLDTVRSFALARLTEGGSRIETERSHATYFARVAADGQRNGVDELNWYRLMRDAEANVRKAISWCVVHDPEMGADALMGAYMYIRRVTGLFPGWLEPAQQLIQSTQVSPATRQHLRAILVNLKLDQFPSQALASEALAIAIDPQSEHISVLLSRSALANLAILGYGGDLREAYVAFFRAAAIANARASRQSELSFRGMQAWALDGDLPKAREYILRAIDLVDSQHYFARLPLLLRDVAAIDEELGDYESAVRFAHEAIQAADAIGSHVEHIAAQLVVAEVQLDTGSKTEALRLAIDCAWFAYRSFARIDQMQSLLMVARCCAQCGEPDTARDIYGGMLYLVDSLGATPPHAMLDTTDLDAALDAATLPPACAIPTPVPELLTAANRILEDA